MYWLIESIPFLFLRYPNLFNPLGTLISYSLIPPPPIVCSVQHGELIVPSTPPPPPPSLLPTDRRAPGGVFLTLIKNSPTLTAAEKTEVFKKDKKMVTNHKKQAQKRKKEAALKRSKAGQPDQATCQPNFNMDKRLLPVSQLLDGEERMASEGVAGGPEGAELTSTSERAESTFVKNEEAEPFVAKREETEPMQVEESGGVKRNGAPTTSQQQVEMDLDEFERTQTVGQDIILDEV